MSMKKLYCDGTRNDIEFDEVCETIISAPDYEFRKQRNKRIDEIFEHGERTCAFYQKDNMNDVLNMFQTIPFAALNVMIKDYIAGVQAIRDMDQKRAVYLGASTQGDVAQMQEKIA